MTVVLLESYQIISLKNIVKFQNVNKIYISPYKKKTLANTISLFLSHKPKNKVKCNEKQQLKKLLN